MLVFNPSLFTVGPARPRDWLAVSTAWPVVCQSRVLVGWRLSLLASGLKFKGITSMATATLGACYGFLMFVVPMGPGCACVYSVTPG